MSVLEAYWALPEEPGTAIELAEDEADDGLGDVRVLKVREIIKGELVEFEFSVFCVSQCITCNLPDRQRYLLETNLGRKSYPTILEMFPEDSPAWYARDGVTRLVSASKRRPGDSGAMCAWATPNSLLPSDDWWRSTTPPRRVWTSKARPSRS